MIKGITIGILLFFGLTTFLIYTEKTKIFWKNNDKIKEMIQLREARSRSLDKDRIKKMQGARPLPTTPSPIGLVYTLGSVKGQRQKIKIQCCAVPVGRRKGRIISGEKIELPSFLSKILMQDYDVFIKFWPQKPDSHGQWEAALVVAIYSAIFNRVLPPTTLVLGGVDATGRLEPLAMEKDFLAPLPWEQPLTILVPYNPKGKEKHPLQGTTSYSIKAMQHIREIIILLEPYHPPKS